MKEIKKILFLVPTFIYILCGFMFYVFSNFIEKYNITKLTSNESDFILLIIILMSISIIFLLGEIIYSLYHLSKNKKMDINTKYLWILFICLFNIFTVPYYALKNIFKDKKSVLKIIIYYVLLILSLFISFIIIKNVLK